MDDRSTDRWRPRRARGAAALAVVALAVLGSSACGGGSGTSGGPAASGAASGAAPGAPSAGARTSAPEGDAGLWLRTFTGTTVDGAPFTGSSLAGRPTVLWFWAPWCPTCLQQAPGVRDAMARLGSSVNFVGVAGLDKAANMPEFVRLAKIGSMTSVADEAGVIWKRFQIREQSYFVVLDADGKQVYRGKLHAEDVPAKIAQVVA